MADLSVARRYARALFALAREQDAAAAVGEELQRLCAAELRPALALLRSPVIGKREKEELLRGLAGELRLRALVQNFGLLLVRAGRASLLPAAAREYARLEDEAAGRVRGTLRSAAPLERAAREQLLSALQARLEKAVLLQEEVQPQLLAGVRVEVGGRVFDNSLQRKLELIRETFAQMA